MYGVIMRKAKKWPGQIKQCNQPTTNYKSDI